MSPWSDSSPASRRSPDRADHAGGHRRLAVARWRRWPSAAAPDVEVVGAAEHRDREAAGVDGDHADVGGQVGADELALDLPAVGEHHGDRGGAGHLVGAGDHDAVVAHDHPARLRRRRPAVVTRRRTTAGLTWSARASTLALVGERSAAATIGVTFTRSIDPLGVHREVAGEGEHAAAEHGADEAGDQRDRPHRGPPLGRRDAVAARRRRRP